MDSVTRARAQTLAKILDAVVKELNELVKLEANKTLPGGLSESLKAADIAEDRDRLQDAADAAYNAASILGDLQPRPR